MKKIHNRLTCLHHIFIFKEDKKNTQCHPRTYASYMFNICMGHLQLSMWIKVHLNQDTLVVSEFSNFTILNLTISFKFLFLKARNCKTPRRIRTYNLQIFR